MCPNKYTETSDGISLLQPSDWPVLTLTGYIACGWMGMRLFWKYCLRVEGFLSFFIIIIKLQTKKNPYVPVDKAKPFSTLVSLSAIALKPAEARN